MSNRKLHLDLTSHKKYELVFRVIGGPGRIPDTIEGFTSILEEDRFLHGLLSAGELKGSKLYLFPRSLRLAPEVRSNVTRLAQHLKVELVPVEQKYLFHLAELAGTDNYHVDLQRLNRDNDINAVGMYKRSSFWLLELQSVEDVVKLLERKHVYIAKSGKAPVTANPIRDDAVFIHCFKCAKAGHYQDKCKSLVQVCSKCGGEHEARHCTVTKLEDCRCPNCEGEDARGHAAYTRRCQNPNSRAEWKRAAAAAKLRPQWFEDLVPSKRSGSQRQHQGPQKPQGEHDKPAAARKRGRPSPGSATVGSNKRQKLADPPKACVKRFDPDFFAIRKPKSSQPSTTTTSFSQEGPEMLEPSLSSRG